MTVFRHRPHACENVKNTILGGRFNLNQGSQTQHHEKALALWLGDQQFLLILITAHMAK